LGSNLSRFSSGDKLKPFSNLSSNPDSSNSGSGLLLSPSKVPNPPNEFAPMMPKCEKCLF